MNDETLVAQVIESGSQFASTTLRLCVLVIGMAVLQGVFLMLRHDLRLDPRFIYLFKP